MIIIFLICVVISSGPQTVQLTLNIPEEILKEFSRLHISFVANQIYHEKIEFYTSRLKFIHNKIEKDFQLDYVGLPLDAKEISEIRNFVEQTLLIPWSAMNLNYRPKFVFFFASENEFAHQIESRLYAKTASIFGKYEIVQITKIKSLIVLMDRESTFTQFRLIHAFRMKTLDKILRPLSHSIVKARVVRSNVERLVLATNDWLKCPVCMEMMMNHIPQCLDGHPICWKCYWQIKEHCGRCPMCRQQYPTRMSRNVVLENLRDTLLNLKPDK